MASTRQDGDTWDLASGVGTTATMAAAARAIATRADRALIDDPYAEPLVRAVGIEVLTRVASGEEPPGDLVEPLWIDVAKVRTRFYDDFFLDAANAGLRQAVILASGLDSRAYRLPWPSGMVVYELDQPQVIEFKTRAMAGVGAEPAADRRTVAADLREDWPSSLRAAGFDPARATAWSAEGLLGYLPPEAQDLLLDTVTGLSAPGSRLATESRPNPRPGEEAKTRERLERMSERWRARSFDPAMAKQRYYGERNEAAPYLTGLGWTLTGSTIRELFAAHGLPPLEDDGLRMGDLRYVSGVLG